MTTCETCRRAELTALQRLREDALSLLLGPSADAVLRRYSFTLTATTVTWYARHRELFVEAGDWQELRRMLRHVR